MEGTFVNRPNVQLIYDTLARILGEQYGAKVTVTVRPKTKEASYDVEKSEEIPSIAV